MALCRPSNQFILVGKVLEMEMEMGVEMETGSLPQRGHPLHHIIIVPRHLCIPNESLPAMLPLHGVMMTKMAITCLLLEII